MLWVTLNPRQNRYKFYIFKFVARSKSPNSKCVFYFIRARNAFSLVNKGNNGIVASLFIHIDWYKTHSVSLIIQIIRSERKSNQAECYITKLKQDIFTWQIRTNLHKHTHTHTNSHSSIWAEQREWEAAYGCILSTLNLNLSPKHVTISHALESTAKRRQKINGIENGRSTNRTYASIKQMIIMKKNRTKHS